MSIENSLHLSTFTGLRQNVISNVKYLNRSFNDQFVISWHQYNMPICDMIKRNESDVGDVVLEILAKTSVRFLCFILFLALTKSFITLEPDIEL